MKTLYMLIFLFVTSTYCCAQTDDETTYNFTGADKYAISSIKRIGGLQKLKTKYENIKDATVWSTNAQLADGDTVLYINYVFEKEKHIIHHFIFKYYRNRNKFRVLILKEDIGKIFSFKTIMRYTNGKEYTISRWEKMLHI